MKSIREFSNAGLKVVFTDIDGTLTQDGLIPALSYSSIWKLQEAGLHVVPVTGRPAGWCDMIARTWPVRAVIGENGAFYFQMKNKIMQRHFFIPEAPSENVARLRQIESEVLKKIPRSRVASDQFARLFDLAIDFAEDIEPSLSKDEIHSIVKIFEQHGAHAKISNIHVNGWFGDFDKRSMVQEFLKREFPTWTTDEIQMHCTFIGDSPNDEPMFEFFSHSFGVQNIKSFWSDLKHHPTYVADKNEGLGFQQIAECILKICR